jgi:hypothetical protein
MGGDRPSWLGCSPSGSLPPDAYGVCARYGDTACNRVLALGSVCLEAQMLAAPLRARKRARRKRGYRQPLHQWQGH